MLSKMQNLFEQGGKSGPGILEASEFIDICLQEGMHTVVSEQQCTPEFLFEMFQKIDVNNDGGLEWHEFVNYLLYSNMAQLSTGGNDRSQEYIYQPIASMNFSRMNSVNQITKIVYNKQDNCMFSSSMNGSFKVWNAVNLQHRQTVVVDNYSLSDICLCEHLQLLISCVVNGKLHFTRCDNLSLNPIHSESISTVPLCCTSWTEGTLRSVAHVAVGDDRGNIFVYVYPEGIDNMKRKKTYKYRVHSGWVTSMQYLHSLQVLASASADSTIVLYDLQRDRIAKKYEAHQQAVNALAYSSAYRTMYSVGAERLIYVWDPYSCVTMTNMVGHTAPITSVVVREEYNQLVVMLSIYTAYYIICHIHELVWCCR